MCEPQEVNDSPRSPQGGRRIVRPPARSVPGGRDAPRAALHRAYAQARELARPRRDRGRPVVSRVPWPRSGRHLRRTEPPHALSWSSWPRSSSARARRSPTWSTRARWRSSPPSTTSTAARWRGARRPAHRTGRPKHQGPRW